MKSNIYTLEELVDLALQTPEIGSVNFNILKLILHKILFECKIQNVTTEWIPALASESEGLNSIEIPPGLLSPKSERKDERGKVETKYEKVGHEKVDENGKFITRGLKTEPKSKNAKKEITAKITKSESESDDRKLEIEPGYIKQKIKPGNVKSKALTEDVKGKTDPEYGKSKALTEKVKGKTVPEHAKGKALTEDVKGKTVPEHAKGKTDPKHAKDKTELEYKESKIEPRVSGAKSQPKDMEEKSEPEDADVTLKATYHEVKQKDYSKMKPEVKVSIKKLEDEGEKEKKDEAHTKEEEALSLQKIDKESVSEGTPSYSRKPTDTEEKFESALDRDETKAARYMIQRWELKKIIKRVEAVEEGLNIISISVEELVDWKRSKMKRFSIPEEPKIDHSGPTIGREEFEDAIEEIGEALIILQSRLTKQKEECDSAKQDILKEINLRPTGEEMNRDKEELIEKLNILGTAISNMQNLIKDVICPEACGTTKCLTCGRNAHLPLSGIVLDGKKITKDAFVESEKKVSVKKKLKQQVELPFTTARLKRIKEEGKAKRGEPVSHSSKENHEDKHHDAPICSENFITVDLFDISDIAKDFAPLRPFPDVMRRNYIHIPSINQVDRPSKAAVRISQLGPNGRD